LPTVPLLEVDALEVTMLVDNQIDALLTGEEQVRRQPWDRSVRNPFLDGGGPGLATLRAEHGFSALVTVTRGTERHTLLFDTGVSPNGMIDNLDRLQLDPKEIEAVALSHGHADHTAGLAGLAERLGRANLPVLAHRLAFTRRRMAPPQGEPIHLPPPSRSALEGAGFEIVESDDPSLLFHDALLLTGEVPRVTDFEQGFPFFQRASGDGWEPEPHLMDDQALVANVKGKGLVVLTGCGHSGIVNIVTRAVEVTGVGAVQGVMGGFHLVGPFFEPLIPLVVDRLRQFDAKFIVPAHCTGYKAQQAMAAAMPEAYVQNAVGTTYLF
jgi:7,8-dihydropterin-6-yl-methyl-4-(beta-D-ribofuranosyl)aminobenzene 5'-phosphate synthase